MEVYNRALVYTASPKIAKDKICPNYFSVRGYQIYHDNSNTATGTIQGKNMRKKTIFSPENVGLVFEDGTVYF